ncbi:MAG: hypothetical protein NWE79_03930 [Candidatus Bathyarchaeota archaeon]|nr:hypothetical protein [Candidatus Bathyarchaeota archaeon]
MKRERRSLWVADLDERPVAQILFYPEEAIPFIAHPRKGARKP